MSELTDFAGKYGAFIWPAYGASLLAFAWIIADTVLRARRWRREVRRLEEVVKGPGE
jgi:heme exporter protein D